MARIKVDKNWTELTTTDFLSAQCVPDNEIQGSFEGELKRAAELPGTEETGNLIKVGNAGTPDNLASAGVNLYGRVYGGKGDGGVAFEVG